MIEDDPTLTPPPEGRPVYFENPILIVNRRDDGSIGYVFAPNEIEPGFDPMGDKIFAGGILLSDILDHMAHAYSATTGMTQDACRKALWREARDENRLKERDPDRYKARGFTTVTGRKQ